MRLASVSHSLVNSVLARPILDDKGMILLGEGVCLSERLIDRLKSLGVYSVYIADELTSDLVVEDPVSDKTRRLAIQTVQESVDQLKLQSLKNPKYASRQSLGREFSKAFQEILSDIQSSPNSMINLASIFTADGYLYHHSVNVTILATVIGLAKGYNQRQLTELGIGAMMHDIGMLNLPADLIKKAGSYSPPEWQSMKQHTVLGYEYLKTQDGVSTLSAHISLQHHERGDGSGYPRGLTLNEIHEYAKIVAVCDVFDAMNSRRNYRKEFLPHETLEYLMGGSGTLFDHSVITLFVKNVAIYPLGLSVLLNNGQKAVVVQINPEYPQRPIVRPISNPDGSQMQHAQDVDLTKSLTLMITGIE